MKPSLQSKIFTWIFKLFSFGLKVEKRAQEDIARSKKGFVPRGIKRRYLINFQTLNERGIATFESKEKVTENHIIFFHGGAYIFEAAPFHWRLAERIVKKCFCRMTLVDYPLAPEHNYKETFKFVSTAYELLTDQYPGDNLILMGDSAGGGLALAFTQKLIKDKHQKLPARLVLLSPWLDITMSNPDIKNLESSDYILTVKMLRIAGKKYADGENQDQFLLSPINGEMKGLPATIVFYGTEELFRADCLRFKTMSDRDTQNIIFREYEKMQHDWALFPIPESKQVVNEICEFIQAGA